MQFTINPIGPPFDLIGTGSTPTSGILTINNVPPDGGGNLSLVAGAGITITDDIPGNSITISADGTYTGTATTVDASTATLLTIPMADNSSTTFDVLIAGYESTLPAAVGSSLIASFIRSGGGVPTVIQDPDDQQNLSAILSSVSYSITGSGANVIVTVTGQAGVTINWRGTVRTISAP